MIKFFKLLTLSSLSLFFASCGGNGDGKSLDHRIFVTTASYKGSQIGGVTGADEKCAAAASAAGIEGTYKAIISTSTSNIIDTLNFTGAVYKLTAVETKVEIVAVGSDLWNTRSVDLLAKVNRDESYAESSSNPWTGTDDDGEHTDYNCTNWTSDAGSGDYGSTSHVTSEWLEDPWRSLCNIARPLFCISQ